jgi:rhamnose transport system ATP-binding protein
MTSPILEMKHVSKRFGMTQALDDVSLTLYPGEIHSLLGENGAGKSTLIKIMTGIYQADQGEILLNGRPVTIQNAIDAQAQGIAAIQQEPMIFPDLNVAENIFISHRNRGKVIRWRQMYNEAEAILAKLGIRLDVRSSARGLTLAAQQAVEIAKAISLDVRVLIMDEPTASLSSHEVEQLFKLVQSLRNQGVAILFISHRMEEVFAISDHITIFRDGKFISSAPRQEVTPESAIQDMVGREVGDFFSKSESEQGDVFLKVQNLGKENAFSDINFEVRAGEVLGFAGLVGSRRTDVGLAIFGVEPADTGEILVENEPVSIRGTQHALSRGIAYVTEDRRQLGLTMSMSIATNITLPTLKRYTNKLGLIRRGRERETAEKFKDRLSIRTPSIQLEAGKLSGGNQQKVVLSKWLNTQPRLLILDEPTRGIDVGAKAEVHQIINELAQEGMAIIMISSDLPEVLAMSDRILVMREGQQMGIFDRQEATQEKVMTAAMGQASASVEVPA